MAIILELNPANQIGASTLDHHFPSTPRAAPLPKNQPLIPPLFERRIPPNFLLNAFIQRHPDHRPGPMHIRNRLPKSARPAHFPGIRLRVVTKLGLFWTDAHLPRVPFKLTRRQRAVALIQFAHTDNRARTTRYQPDRPSNVSARPANLPHFRPIQNLTNKWLFNQKCSHKT